MDNGHRDQCVQVIKFPHKKEFYHHINCCICIKIEVSYVTTRYNCGTFPICTCNSLFIVAVTCNNPPNVLNSVIQPQTGPYQCNGVVTYQCNAGYTIQGNSRLTCGNSGQWSGFAPSCVREEGMLIKIMNENVKDMST